jgi:hypothetical protein
MNRHLRQVALVTALALLCCRAAQSQPAGNAAWDGWQMLEGKWVGEGTSELGRGSGYFSFEPDLLGKAWVRRNHSEYPGVNGQPASVHEDLMIVYIESANGRTRAFYTDTEGHSIHYSVTLSADRKTVTFLGDVQPGQATYRLTYVSLAPGRLSVVLEMAPPDAPGRFKRIVEGTVGRT